MHVAPSATVRALPAVGELPGLPARWLAIPWLFGIATLWWITFEALATGVPDAGAEVPREILRVGIAMALGFKLLGSLAETGFYSGWWLLRGRRLSWVGLWVWLSGLSLLDAFALLLPWAIEPEGGLARTAIAVLCGPRTLVTPDEILADPMIALFGPLGALTLLRIGLTAWAQVRAVARPWPGPLAITSGAWLAVRVVTWWLGELMRGQSAAMLGGAS